MEHSILLNNGQAMPLLGYGVYKLTDDEATNCVLEAISSGYRLIDTASVYKNEAGVGLAIAKSTVPREELFITTKLWNTAQQLGDVDGAFNRSLDRLGLDYVDLYLIHWPVSGCYTSSWQQLVGLLDSGKVKSIGVSNFQIHHLEELKNISGIVPAVNQIECNPLCYPKELIDYCKSNGIAIQGYSPLARGAYLDNDIVCILGTKYAHKPANIGLRWAIQHGISVIPKSSDPARILSNAQVFDFDIEPEDMALLDTLNENYHVSVPPADLEDYSF